MKILGTVLALLLMACGVEYINTRTGPGEALADRKLACEVLCENDNAVPIDNDLCDCAPKKRERREACEESYQKCLASKTPFVPSENSDELIEYNPREGVYCYRKWGLDGISCVYVGEK